MKLTLAVIALALCGTASADDWLQVTPRAALKAIPDSVRLTPDGHHVATFRAWVRFAQDDLKSHTGHYIGRGYVVSLIEVNCLSAPRTYRDLITSAYDAVGNRIGTDSTAGSWSFILPGSFAEDMSSPCDMTPGAGT